MPMNRLRVIMGTVLYWDTDDYNGTEDMMFDIMMANPDYTPEDAWEVYCMNFPELTETEFLKCTRSVCWLTALKCPKYQHHPNGKVLTNPP